MPDVVTQDDNLGNHKPSRFLSLLRPKIAIPLILLTWVIFTPLIYRQSRLSQVPDIGDPFPVSEILKPISEEDNAYPLFEEAFALRKEVSSTDHEAYLKEEMDGWDPTDILLNKYLKLNQAALEKWREATEKDDYQIVPFEQVWEPVDMHYLVASRELARLCQLEIDRLVQSEKPNEAFSWLRASFRCSGLVTRNALSLDRLVGIAYFSMSTDSAEKWMQHPDLTSAQLLELLTVVNESSSLIVKLSTTIKMDYLVIRHWYARWSYTKMKHDPPLGSKLETWLFAEPEFSRRLSLHVTANHLPFIDLPRRDRPPILDGDIFDESAVGANLNGRLPASELMRQMKKAKLFDAESDSFIENTLEFVDRNRARNACLQIALAAQAYFRDHDEFPERLSELQPKYLTSIPDDPFSPTPATVIYRRTDHGGVVYSRYHDGVDNGGTTVTHEEARGAKLLDYGIRIRTPWKHPLVAPRPKRLNPSPISRPTE